MIRYRPLLATALLVGLATSSVLGGVLIDDKFTGASQPQRNLTPGRGTWKVADGVATCTQDDQLYKKNKDHGPIMWYDAKFTDGVVQFAFKPEKCKTFVFTLNNDKGHVFRFVVTPSGLSVRAWPVQGHDAKSVGLLTPKPGTPALKDGEWLVAKLKFASNRCTLSLGPDFEQTFENPAIGFDKTQLGLGFSFGTLSLRDVKVEQ